jgi:hypothetical protein
MTRQAQLGAGYYVRTDSCTYLDSLFWLYVSAPLLIVVS